MCVFFYPKLDLAVSCESAEFQFYKCAITFLQLFLVRISKIVISDMLWWSNISLKSCGLDVVNC
jgi:hypothetical protein